MLLLTGWCWLAPAANLTNLYSGTLIQVGSIISLYPSTDFTIQTINPVILVYYTNTFALTITVTNVIGYSIVDFFGEEENPGIQYFATGTNGFTNLYAVAQVAGVQSSILPAFTVSPGQVYGWQNDVGVFGTPAPNILNTNWLGSGQIYYLI